MFSSYFDKRTQLWGRIMLLPLLITTSSPSFSVLEDHALQNDTSTDNINHADVINEWLKKTMTLHSARAANLFFDVFDENRAVTWVLIRMLLEDVSK